MKLFCAFYFPINSSVAHRTARSTHSTALPQHAAGAASALQQQRTYREHRHTIHTHPQPKYNPLLDVIYLKSQLSPSNSSSNVCSVEGHPDQARVTQPTSFRSIPGNDRPQTFPEYIEHTQHNKHHHTMRRGTRHTSRDSNAHSPTTV